MLEQELGEFEIIQDNEYGYGYGRVMMMIEWSFREYADEVSLYPAIRLPVFPIDNNSLKDKIEFLVLGWVLY